MKTPLHREVGRASSRLLTPREITFFLFSILVFGVMVGSLFTAFVVAPDVPDHVCPQVEPGSPHSHCHEAVGGFRPRCYRDNHCPGGDLCPLEPNDNWLTPYIEAP